MRADLHIKLSERHHGSVRHGIAESHTKKSRPQAHTGLRRSEEIAGETIYAIRVSP